MPCGHPRFSFRFLLLASLVAHRAARLAGGLAGRLTFAAAAFLHRLLERRLVDCLDMLHLISSYESIYVYCTLFFARMQAYVTIASFPRLPQVLFFPARESEG